VEDAADWGVRDGPVVFGRVDAGTAIAAADTPARLRTERLVCSDMAQSIRGMDGM